MDDGDEVVQWNKSEVKNKESSSATASAPLIVAFAMSFRCNPVASQSYTQSSDLLDRL